MKSKFLSSLETIIIFFRANQFQFSNAALIIEFNWNKNIGIICVLVLYNMKLVLKCTDVVEFLCICSLCKGTSK